MTFVDYAELVWNRLNDGQTQQAVADGIGWSRAQVSQYAMLREIGEEAWKVIATGFSVSVADDADDDVAASATSVATPFSEGLLRHILSLTADQQLELCKKLAKGKDSKTGLSRTRLVMAATGKEGQAAKDDARRFALAGEVILSLIEQSRNDATLLTPDKPRTLHLVEIHQAPREQWPLLAGLLAELDWSVKDTKAAHPPARGRYPWT